MFRLFALFERVVMYRQGQLVILICVAAFTSVASAVDIAVRAENFTVPPATGPVTHILVRNAGDLGCTVTIKPEFPDGWQWTPDSRRVTLAPGEINRLPFNIERASDSKTNRYPIEVAVVQGSDRTVHRQNVVCASAPYFKPKIDGKFKDWADAIPVTFTTSGKKTVVSTYWDKRNFYLYVQVEEDKLYSYKKNAPQIDAVQFALAARDAFTQSEPRARAQRVEFLMVDVSGMFARDKCFKLIAPGQPLSITQQPGNLESLALKEARVVVKRQGKVTHYECAVPFAAIPAIRPAVGREIRFSVLVHDPDGTGLRDWGEAAGLWPHQRNRYAWCLWHSAKWNDGPPYDGKVKFGLCSSKR
ncbi:MAG: hypothetical protein ACYS7Y_31435 [Planctomycetota bacterium]